MHSQTIRTALGQLQDDPDSESAWESLRTAARADDRDLPTDDLLGLLAAARERHASRGEGDAVLELLALEVELAKGSASELPLLRERARVQREELFDEPGAVRTLERLLELAPDDVAATDALEESRGKAKKWQELVSTYSAEAEQAPDDVYKSSMLMRAAEMELRFGEGDADRTKIRERLEQALRLDATNVRASRMLERMHAEDGRWDDAAKVLERTADRAETATDRVAAATRLGRLARHKLNDSDRAAKAYERVLKDRPDQSEAMRFLAELYEREERWDELVALYERDLKSKDLTNPERLGDMFQIAMLYWKKASRPKDAEPWFERIAKLEPAHPGMLAFYRDYAAELGDEGRLMEILQSAQRSMKEGPEKAQLSTEIARLAEGQENAQKAIEQYKGVLRQDPDSVEARDALKRLYKQTQGYNALVELLRQQLERTDAADVEARVSVLREVAAVYRQFIKSDTALVSVLNQIVQLDEKLDEKDVDEVRELVGLYEKLGRWRDLLTNQLRLAEITSDVDEKKELYRSAARRWLEQFSNVQNATEAYEALLKVDSRDHEARERLHELYRKRRAWPALYDLYETELSSLEGADRIPVMKEMAQLAAERLGRGADAVTLYRQILEIDPTRSEALDSLEKNAERAKDWATLADVLERRVSSTDDEQARIAVLQRLGGVYAEHLNDFDSAAKAWRRVLELSPGHHRALRVLRDSYLQGGDYDGLSELYGSQNDWEGLAEVLGNAADRAKDDASKIDLSYRAAQVYEDRLSQPDRAFRSYERILAADPTDVRAAKKLIPLYEADEKWARLPALYELTLSQADADEQLQMLEKIVDITAHRLADRKAAAQYARKAYELAPDREATLAMFEEASRAAGAFDPFVSALEARLSAASGAPPAAESKKGKKGKKKAASGTAAADGDGAKSGPTDDERRRLELKLARVYGEELGRTEESVATYRRLLERDPSDADAARALEIILRRDDRRDDLRWLLDLRVEHASDDDTRVEVLSDWATLEEEVFQAPERATALHRRVLQLAPTDARSLRALPRLLLDASDVEGAAEAIAMHRDQLQGDERAVRDVELAELELTRLNKPERALDSAVRALDLTPGNPRAIAVLERLMKEEDTKARAAEVLAAQYASGGEARQEVQALSVMLEQTSDEVEKKALFTRLADVHEEKLEAFGNALDVVLRAVRAFPTDLMFWDRAESLAVLAGRPTDLAEAFREVLRADLGAELEVELCERAATLHEERLGDPIGATPYLEKVLDLDAGNERAFGKLKDILTAAERWSELEALYDRASRATDDPLRTTEMLVEVALICEEIIENSAKATGYYERIVAIDPLHDVAIRALDRLYAKQERHADLATLLERRLEAATGDELLELKLRLSRIQLDKLHEPDKAVYHVEDVLRERANDYDARELAEKMLGIGSLRARAARMLEGVYEARDEMRDLVRVLTIRLEELDANPAEADDDDRRDLLRRIALLRDERLHDDDGALDALARLAPMDPLDTDARDRLLEIGRRVGAHARVAEVLTAAADRADTPGLQGEILMKVAHIHEELVADAAKAEATYRRVLELDATDADLVLPAARALERIYMAGGAHEKLADVLRTQVKLEQDGDARKALFGRLGELCQGVLGDTEGAIEAWKSRVEENPGDELALAALDRLYEEASRWRDLVDILARRRDVTDDETLRRKLMVRSAQTLAEKLESPTEAVDAWRTVLEEYGPETGVLVALERLYARTEQWHELADIYERHLDLVEADAERLELLAKLGDLRREHLNDIDGALEAYRRALTLDAAHSPSRGALEKMLQSDEPATRHEAAEILHPIYEADGDNERLLRVLEIEVDATDDLFQKLESLEKAITIAEGPVDNSSRAFGYAERAVRVAVGHTEIAPWLAHVERLAAKIDRPADLVKLLSTIIGDIFDGEVQLDVTLKVADIARHQLADRELAREHYQKALELRSDDKRALLALESLFEETGDAKSLLEILERRTEVMESDADRSALMYRRAKLLSDILNDNARAIEVYEGILDLAFDREAVDALETLYTLEQRWVELTELYQRQLDEKQGDSAALHVKIARVLAQRQNEVGRAFDELEQALEIEKQHGGAIAELERLMAEAAEAEHRSRAAEVLEPVYLLRAEFAKVMDCIRARLDFEQDPVERRELLSRLAQLYEEQKEDYVAALETVAKLLHEDVGDASTVAELERLAKVAGAERRLAEIYAEELEGQSGDDESSAKLAARAGEIFAGLGDLERGLGFLRRALAFDPESRTLFDAIDSILERTGRHAERVEHYRAALDHRFDPKERAAALHTIARLQRAELGQKEDAIENYRAALDVDERDPIALEALTELYAEAERYAELSDHYLRRAELADTAEAGAPYRLALARLLRSKLDETDRAIDQLEEIVRSVPSHAEAVKELELLVADEKYKERVVEILRPLYEGSDDWRRLIRLNEERYALAETPAEKVAVLRETAELWEKRGEDVERARRALGIAFDLDPDDGDVRGEFERLIEVTSSWDKLTQAYEAALEKNPDMLSKRDVLAVLAQVHDQRRDDPRAALDAYERLRATDESDPAPLAKMEQLATLLSDWPVLVRVLSAKAELSLDDEERASLWRRIGEAKRDMLDDAEGAIAAYERALELEPDSAFTVDCLIQLRESGDAAEPLVELYQRRVELTDVDDRELRHELLTSAAKVYEEKLGDRNLAIEMLNQALGAMPEDSGVIANLGRLYRAEEMWPELLDNLRLEASRAESSEERARLRRDIGDILADKMSTWDEAVEAYRMVLDDTPSDEKAVERLLVIAREHEHLRESVTAALVPVLRISERWSTLPEVLELRLTVESEPEARAETLRSIAETFEQRLQAPDQALAALLRAVSELPAAPDLHTEIERLAEATSGWQRYADTLAERAQSTFEPEVGKELYRRLGRVAEEKLSDDARAVEAYTHAVEQAGDQPELLEALDRLYTRLESHQDLSEILERRVSIEEGEAARAALYHRIGVIQARHFQEPGRALSSFRAAIEHQADHAGAIEELEKLTDQRDLFEEAAEVLEGVYRNSGKTDRLPALYEKRVSFADTAGERIDMRKNLARVLEEDCSDAASAQRVLQQGLMDDPGDSGLLDEIERLAPVTHDWESAAAALRKAIDEKSDLVPDMARDLCVRLASWLRDRVEDPRGAEAALEKALEFDPQSDEVLVLLEQLQRMPGRERELVGTLRRRAKLQLDEQRREDLHREAKSLADGLGDAELAETIVRELLQYDDTNLWALGTITELSEAAGRWQEVYELLVRRAELRADGGIVRELRHRAASVARDELKQSDSAIALYEQLFEDDPTDKQASNGLVDLLQSTGKYAELGRLLERLVDLADSSQERAELRLRLARLNVDQFEAVDSAIDILRQVLEDEPGHADAVVMLSELLEKAERDEELAELLSEQIRAARERGDVDAELTFRVRLGEVYDTRIGDRARAIEAYREVLERQADHRGALEALSRLYQAAENHAESANILERLLAMSSGEDAVRLATLLADARRRMGDQDGAIAALERGLDAKRDDTDLREQLRAAYESASAWEKLANLIAEDASLAASEADKIALYRKAAAIHADRRKDLGAAAELLEKASALSPEDREILLELCDAYSASGRGKAAAEVLEKIVESYGGKRSKELGEIHRRLADAYLADGDKDRALGELDKAFRIEPGNVLVLRKLGMVALETGDMKKAQQMFRALLLQKLDDGSPITKAEVFMHLGEVHEKLGEKSKAVQMYERAVQSDDKLTAAKARLDELKG